MTTGRINQVAIPSFHCNTETCNFHQGKYHGVPSPHPTGPPQSRRHTPTPSPSPEVTFAAAAPRHALSSQGVTPFHEVARRTECHPSDNSRGSPSSIPLRLWAPHRSTLSAVRRYTASATSLNPSPPRIIILFFSELGPNAVLSSRSCWILFFFKVHHLCGAVKKAGSIDIIPLHTQNPNPARPNPKHPCHFGGPDAV
jgi:hypothetical protein